MKVMVRPLLVSLLVKHKTNQRKNARRKIDPRKKRVQKFTNVRTDKT